jgi:hypothetical protein
MAKWEISVKVYFGEIDEIIKELRQLQTYKLFEGAEEVLVDINDVARVLAKHVKATFAQPEQRWIPVSEMLPEDEYVLVSKIPTKISGDKWSVAIAIRTADPRSRKIQWRDSGFCVIQDDKVLAWMPLPQPYKAESEDKE